MKEFTMPLTTWGKNLFRANRKGRRKEPRVTSRIFRPALEILECRCLPALVTLATFNGANGDEPLAGLTEDSSGNLFGTTYQGGDYGDGTIFKVATQNNNALTTLVSFDGANGLRPVGGVIEDSNGNLFGTTSGSGANSGTIFEFSTVTNTLTTLASVGGSPQAGLIEDSSGNLFGTVASGGIYGDGAVFEYSTATNTLSTLASFNGYDGANPQASLIEDGSGNLFGTTWTGGTYNPNTGQGCGTVFEVATQSNNALTTLVYFDGTNGYLPACSLIEDNNGDLFGTTFQGGVHNDGTVFEFATGNNTLSTTSLWLGAADPLAGLLEDSGGNLFGTSYGGGSGYGTVFKVSAGISNVSVIASFDSTDGYPQDSLIEDSAGDLFGTTNGAYGDGIVFEVTPVTVTVTNVVINQDIPALYNAAGQPFEGAQRSMVNDIVFTFSEPVNILDPSVDPNVFTVAVASGWTGTVPTLSWASVTGSGDMQWAVSFSGAGVTGGSIANGAYTITVTDPASITAESDGQALTFATGGIGGDTQSFYRLFGDVNGDGFVNAADNSKFKQGMTTYNAAFDYDQDGFVNAVDNSQFKNDLTLSFSGFTPTI
jgi:uncharacterized repeat protein (TIGR03803 family)